MNVSLEEGELEIEIESPLANFLPFEHAPETAEQRLEVRRMLAKLKQPNALFTANGRAGCRETKREFESDALESEHAHEHAAHAAHQTHADLEIEQSFRCSRPQKLTALSTGLFDQFPALKEVRVQIITGKGQKYLRLTPDNPRLQW